MATIVMITGTNCAGKTTLAKELIKRVGGGINQTLKDRTICNNRKVVFLGRYADDVKHGGVDGLNQTKCLEEIAKECISSGAEYVICEGSYLNTFGLNLQRLLFSAEKQVVVSLFAPIELIRQRLQKRSGGKMKDTIYKKQVLCFNSLKKWRQIGVQTFSFNVAETKTEDIANFIIKAICK